MQDRDKALSDLRTALGHRPLHRSWAKVEIVLGLFSAGLGLLLSDWAIVRSVDVAWLLAGGGLLLFVLGGYLTLAGHRSHLYQSNNELVAYLAEEIRSLKSNPR